ncbi:phosphatidylserine decarboxylase [Candidatus Paracaedibacter symbiosus]|uniref:phosphatidylserine decarboxylase n=1 Tax=Candidatus Paracaedibacter symbiosus TaxID=244582 RepID=UPI0005098188|nr:phosphatidylserine decarboxylase [Candidatus Paracaedibacter symbiosus]
MIKNVYAPIHNDGWKFVGIFALITVILYCLASFLGFIGLILTCWCYYFFRSPKRTTPLRDGLIVSPADGTVCLIQQVTAPAEYEIGNEERTRVSIFLNVFDVHVQRIALSGKVKKIIYHPGKFLNASFDKASDENERQTVIVQNGDIEIAFTQIAGLIARRIRCDIQVGQEVSLGQLYGLIRFGSRVDIYLPPNVNPLVFIGQKMIGGETVIADLASPNEQRASLTH